MYISIQIHVSIYCYLWDMVASVAIANYPNTKVYIFLVQMKFRV